MSRVRFTQADPESFLDGSLPCLDPRQALPGLRGGQHPWPTSYLHQSGGTAFVRCLLCPVCCVCLGYRGYDCDGSLPRQGRFVDRRSRKPGSVRAPVSQSAMSGLLDALAVSNRLAQSAMNSPKSDLVVLEEVVANTPDLSCRDYGSNSARGRWGSGASACQVHPRPRRDSQGDGPTTLQVGINRGQPHGPCRVGDPTSAMEQGGSCF
jgi:hypothetical protein